MTYWHTRTEIIGKFPNQPLHFISSVDVLYLKESTTISHSYANNTVPSGTSDIVHDACMKSVTIKQLNTIPSLTNPQKRHDAIVF